LLSGGTQRNVLQSGGTGVIMGVTGIWVKQLPPKRRNTMYDKGVSPWPRCSPAKPCSLFWICGIINRSASNEQKAEPPDELQQLREENARLKALLNSHGIAWGVVSDTESDSPTAESPPTANHLTTGEKIALFRRLFRGRTDVYSRHAGNRPRVRPVIHRPAGTNGSLASATNRRSNAVTAPSACCCR